jgi:2-amino-4-hydroxy-6-hydroxymethyldihydropteridine diphosphokinase
MLLLGLGSNVGDRKKMLTNAIILIGEIIGEVKAISNIYETSPEGFDSPNDFFNAAIAVETDLPPLEILARTQAIEREMGRTHSNAAPSTTHRASTYEDRCIDIDILFYNNLIHTCETLQIPHPLAHTRSFVLEPLADIAPEFQHPKLCKSMADLLKEVL